MCHTEHFRSWYRCRSNTYTYSWLRRKCNSELTSKDKSTIFSRKKWCSTARYLFLLFSGNLFFIHKPAANRPEETLVLPYPIWRYESRSIKKAMIIYWHCAYDMLFILMKAVELSTSGQSLDHVRYIMRIVRSSLPDTTTFDYTTASMNMLLASSCCVGRVAIKGKKSRLFHLIHGIRSL